MKGTSRGTAAPAGFTIIELLVVIAIIIVLAALVLGTVGYVQKKGARSRAEAEIAAMSAALESYKADNGIYPTDPGLTENVNPTASPVPEGATLYLFEQLSGLDPTGAPVAGMKTYFTFKPQMMGGPRDPNGNVTPIKFIKDPFGNPYGYSTMKASGGIGGYNPTFDLWSTANASPPADQNQWIKNW